MKIKLEKNYVLIKPINYQNESSKSIIISEKKTDDIYGVVVDVSNNIDFLIPDDIVFFNKKNSVEVEDMFIVNASMEANKIYFKIEK